MNEKEEEKYVEGYLVGMFSVVIVFLPYAIALDVLAKLPSPYFNTIGMLIWIGAFFFGFLRSLKKVERKLRRFFDRTLFQLSETEKEEK
jgi:hypothetical protein